MFTLHNGDFLTEVKKVADGSVHLVLTDLPYGSLNYEWDSVIPLPDLWREVNRVLTPLGTFITTASQPFTSSLIMSNLEQFKYEYSWKKSMGTNFLHAKNAPIKIHENILVFSKGSINHPTVSDVRMTYNPQLLKGNPYTKKQDPRVHLKWNDQSRPSTNQEWTSVNNGFRYPTSVVEFANGNNHNDGHPTQKPVDLFRWLIRTYSNSDETVFDCTMGSGTTGVAAIAEGRRFIGIEISPEYFAVAKKRIEQAVSTPSFFTPSNTRLHWTGEDSPAKPSQSTLEGFTAPEADTNPPASQ